jgi:ABC-type transport system involved in cytochrome c biogenesis permease subunit
VLRTAQRSEALAIFPPPADAAADRVWRTIADMTDAAMAPGAAAEALPAAIVDSERLVDAVADPERFRVEMERLSNDVRDAAALRGEGRHVDLEVTYYGLDLIYRSLIVFLIGFLMCAVLWLRPNAKWLLRSTVATILFGNLLLTAAIVLRCIVRERPPVSTLYETILFIACVIVFVALIVEWITPRRIVLSLGAFLGALGMFLAMKLEEVERVDTMPSLVAVLDTNFWLATHVTSVTIGYAAGLLAGAIAHVYVIGRLLRWRRTDVAFYKSLARTVYGVLCFALLFALVGTVLGGIWANDSWGRFWGWDPKENGALMIVLSQLAILHARMGGYLRDFGICMSAIAGSIIVAFSWWGVNQLGVGLHSYGFTQGISFALLCFYGIEAITLCLGAFAWFRDRIGADAAAAGVARHTAPPALPTAMPGDGVQSPG